MNRKSCVSPALPAIFGAYSRKFPHSLEVRSVMLRNIQRGNAVSLEEDDSDFTWQRHASFRVFAAANKFPVVGHNVDRVC